MAKIVVDKWTFTHAFDQILSPLIAVTHISILDFIPFENLFD